MQFVILFDAKYNEKNFAFLTTEENHSETYQLNRQIWLDVVAPVFVNCILETFLYWNVSQTKRKNNSFLNVFKLPPFFAFA